VTQAAAVESRQPAVAGLTACELEDVGNPVLLYLQRMQPGASQRTMRQSLEHLADLASGGEIGALALPWHCLKYSDTAALRRELVELDYRPATINLRLAALRGVLREAWRLELMPADDYQRATDIESVQAKPLPRGRALPAGEVHALFSGVLADSGIRGLRDMAIMALLYGGGLRRAELVRTRLVDLDLVKGTLRVLGKGNRQRNVALVGGVLAAVEGWVKSRGRRPGPLFYSTTRKGELSGQRISPGSVRHLCQRRAQQLELEHFSPHDLRRSCATELLDQDVDLATVSKMLGHSELNTTAKYDFRADRATRKAATHLHVPAAINRNQTGGGGSIHEQKSQDRGGGKTRRENRGTRRRRTRQG